MFLPKIAKVHDWIKDIVGFKDVTMTSNFASWLILNILLRRQLSGLFSTPIRSVGLFRAQFELAGCKRKYVAKHYGFFVYVQLTSGANAVLWHYSYTDSAVDLRTLYLSEWKVVVDQARNSFMELGATARNRFMNVPTTNTYLATYCIKVKGFWIKRFIRTLWRLQKSPRFGTVVTE